MYPQRAEESCFIKWGTIPVSSSHWNNDTDEFSVMWFQLFYNIPLVLNFTRSRYWIWCLHLVMASVSCSKRLFKSRELSEAIPQFGLFRFIFFLPGYPPNRYQRQFSFIQIIIKKSKYSYSSDEVVLQLTLDEKLAVPFARIWRVKNNQMM